MRITPDLYALAQYLNKYVHKAETRTKSLTEVMDAVFAKNASFISP